MEKLLSQARFPSGIWAWYAYKLSSLTGRISFKLGHLFQLHQLIRLLSADERRQYLEIEKRMMELLLDLASMAPHIMTDRMSELIVLERTKWEIFKKASQQRPPDQILGHTSPESMNSQVSYLTATAVAFTLYSDSYWNDS